MFTCQVVQIKNGYVVQLPQNQSEPPQATFGQTPDEVCAIVKGLMVAHETSEQGEDAGPKIIPATGV